MAILKNRVQERELNLILKEIIQRPIPPIPLPVEAKLIDLSELKNDFRGCRS